ncbi:MAG: hypothetical protein FWC23_03490 [Chitinispirillia bacterium]|nr:hypothetical protein [Chitinispirillia bacterium]MCL2268238.1 hypothetical protein [Chitinispirillia bacterium]
MDMELLRESVLDFTDERLLDIYRNQREDYHPDAFVIFGDEMARRGIDPNAKVAAAERTEFAAACADAAARNLNRDDFVPLDHPFAKADAVIANTILHDSKIPYVMVKHDLTHIEQSDSVVDTSVFGIVPVPTEIEAFNVMVYKDALPAAKELIEEHFEVDKKYYGGFYTLRQTDFIERLKRFNFNDITMSDNAAHEHIDVDLSKEERAAIAVLACMLMDEADAIEDEQCRIVFFYDSLEGIIDKMKSGAPSLTRTEFLAIIEMCQIYCEDERYNPALNNIASSILDFLMG